MPNTTSHEPRHTTPANPFGPLIATSFRSNGTMRQYHTYNPAADMPTQDDPFRIGATHATKRRNAQSERRFDGREYTAGDGVASASGRSRSWDSLAEGPVSEDVEDSGDSGDSRDDEGSEASSRTLGRSESSGSTVAGDEDDDGKKTSGSEENSDESMEEDGDEEASETSSHTMGRSEDSDSGDDGGDEDSDEEMGESDDEGDVFGKSYREGSRK